MALSPWLYHRVITDSSGGSLAGAVCSVALTSANFDFSLAKSDGSDLRLYDETAGALVPMWLTDYDSVGQTATLYYKSTLTSNAHSLYYGNAGATAVSSFSTVFDHGTGFDADWGDLTTRAGGNGAATRYAGPPSTSDPRNYLFWRLQESPTLSIADLNTASVPNPGGIYTGLREFSLVRDSQNRILSVAGKFYMTFSRRPNVNTATIDGWRCESTSKSGPWSNFTQLYATGSEHLNYPSSVLKIGSTYYMFLTFGWANGGGFTPGLVVQLRTSTDLTTWSAATTVLSPGNFNDQSSGTCTDIGNPWVLPLADGTYVMTIEGYNKANSVWSCYGATCAGPPFATWTPLNSGNPLVAHGAVGTWDEKGAANPKIFQMPDHSFIIQYNGSDNSTSGDWELGFASASAAAGPYTKNAANPVGGHTTATYGVETSHFSWNETGAGYYHICQRFDTTSATAHAYFLYAEPKQGGLCVTRAAAGTDSAFAGVVLDAGTFTAEAQACLTAHRANNSTPVILGLMDGASVPTPMTGAAFNAISSVAIEPNSHDRASPGDLYITYRDPAHVRNFWTGSAWTTSTSPIAADHAREVLATIADDGTNYLLKAAYADDGTSIASASIAKSSVYSMPTGRVLYAGDPLSDTWCSGQFFRRISTRPYVATEPALTLGSKQQAAAANYTLTAPSPASGYANNTSAAFTVTPDGLFTGTVTITPSGGGLSTPIVLTWGASAASKTFTITPSAAGTVTLTPSSGSALTDPSPITYTAIAQTLSVGPLVLTVLSPQTVTFTGTGTRWQSNPPIFTIVGPGAAGTTIGTASALTDTSATALVSPGSTPGSILITDSTSRASATATILPVPVSAITGWSYLSDVSGFAPGLLGSVGYTVLHSDGSVQSARSQSGVFAVGSIGYAAPVALPLSGAYVILWDDGAGHESLQVVSPRGVEPPSAGAPTGLSVEQCLAGLHATLAGRSSGFVLGAGGSPVFTAPDGSTPRVSGVVDQAGNRTAVTVSPPQ